DVDVLAATESEQRHLTREDPMKHAITALSVPLLCLFSAGALASYVDDRAEIENLSNRYMTAVDAGHIETVMAAWAEDGVLEWVRGVERGKEAIRKALSNFGGARPASVPDGPTSRSAERRAGKQR